MRFTVTYKSKHPKVDGNSYKGKIEAASIAKAWELAGSKPCKFGYRVILIEPAKEKKS